ncbi:hypothetical protein Q5752_004362 [Cryptotrichosporon argae]
MPLTGSPFKQRPSMPALRAGQPYASTSTAAAPPVPPKPIDLNSSTRSTDHSTGAKITRRAFLCDVVVERQGEETATLLAHLGTPLAAPSSLPAPPRLTSPREEDEDEREIHWSLAKREDMGKRLRSLIEELVRTERSYVMRLKALKGSYADPLRHFAKQGYSTIVPMYEAKVLFANIDAVLPAATVFLADLEAMWDSGQAEDVVGDVCLRHFKDLKTFEPYRTYISKQDEAQKTFQEMLKKVPTFGSFIESTKYQTTGIGNIGLRELLMEPVQRIPRYTLLWQTMIKCMSPFSSQRAKLLEATEIASRIARCEADAQTVRATIMYCLQRNIENVPANMFSNSRDYIDSIDVDDLPVDYMSPRIPLRPSISLGSNPTQSVASIGSVTSGPASPTKDVQALHCTLFLFDDKLMIVKRQASTVSGRKITGLDDVAKLVNKGPGGIMDLGGKKDKLSFKGTVDILDVIAADVGDGDFHLFLERPPLDQSDRWSARPFRAYTTVHPPYTLSLDPTAARKDKQRFVHNIWAAQALARAKRMATSSAAPPRALVASSEIGLEGAGEVFARAKCYFDVWQRGSWTAARKAKVAIHVDEDGDSPALPLVEDDGETEIDPRLVIRLQPMSGGLCRFSYVTSMGDAEERTVVAMDDVAERIATTIGRFNIFRFRTSTNSAPATPSSTSHRLRPTMLNLDAISRNLFGAGSMSTRTSVSGDAFGTASTKRTRSLASRSSHAESHSSAAAASIAAGGSASRHSAEMRSNASSDAHSASGSKRHSRASMSPSEVAAVEEEDEMEMIVSPLRSVKSDVAASERDLNARLNLARKNSRSMASIKIARVPAPMVDMAQAEEELRAALGGSKSAPVTPTAPLRIVKTPSPTRALRESTPTPIAHAPVAVVTGSAAVTRTPSRPLPTPMGRPTEAQAQMVGSPEPLSPTQLKRGGSRLMGPRSPGVRAGQPPQATFGAAAPLSVAPPHPPSSAAQIGLGLPGSRPPLATSTVPGPAPTQSRVVSGNGRRISLGRETVPLKSGDENEPPALAWDAALSPLSPISPFTIPNPLPHGSVASTASSAPGALAPGGSGTRVVSGGKRQHSGDELSAYPAKRSPSRSPLHPREAQAVEPLKVPSLQARKSRRTSGGALGLRRASGVSVVSAASAASAASEVTETPKARTERKGSVASVVEADENINESRATVRKIKGDMAVIRKQVATGREARRAERAERAGALPRSPQSRNISRRADYAMSPYDDPASSPATSVGPGPRSAGKAEMDAIVVDELARGVSVSLDRLERNLKASLGDLESAQAVSSDEAQAEIAALKNQLVRAREREELVRRQLAESQIEVEEIYNAFNTELDALHSDTQLPVPASLEAARRDVRLATAARNALQLENARLRVELEDERLKREQWAEILRSQGVL